MKFTIINSITSKGELIQFVVLAIFSAIMLWFTDANSDGANGRGQTQFITGILVLSLFRIIEFFVFKKIKKSRFKTLIVFFFLIIPALWVAYYFGAKRHFEGVCFMLVFAVVIIFWEHNILARGGNTTS